MKNLVFDATILANAADKNAGRSGIYFTAYNIAKIFNANKKIKMFFYCEPGLRNRLRYAINNCLTEFRNVPILNISKHKTWFEKQTDYLFFVRDSFRASGFKVIGACFYGIALFSRILFFIPNQFVLSNKRSKLVDCVINLKIKSRESGHKMWAMIWHYVGVLLKIIMFVPYRIICFLGQKRMNNPDLYFSPCFKVPDVFSNNDKIKKYTLIHDVIPFLLPQYFEVAIKSSNGQYWLEQVIQYMKEHPKDKYFANSLCTKNDFLKLVPELRPYQIDVTLLACAETFHPCSRKETEQALKKYNLPTNKKYVFSLCSLEPRKNLIRVVRTFIEFIKKNKIDDMVFVLGGGHWDEFIGKIESEIHNLGKYKDKIIRAGYIDDEDLAPLYSGAEWFVYTSQYEGFGLPVLEALACGCPVITSNNSSLPEVVGNAAIKVDWDSDRQHISAYEKYYFDNTYRNRMISAGLKRAKQFSWKKTVDLMLTDMIKASK